MIQFNMPWKFGFPLMAIFFLDNVYVESIIKDGVDDDNEDDVDDDNREYHNTAILKFDFIEVSCFVGLKPPF